MPDQTVVVTFSPTANPQFTFAPDPVTLTAAGKIILNRAPHSSWTFTGATISAGGGQFGNVTVNPAGTNIQIDDACTSAGRYCYTVSVLSGGTPYTSPDPEIINDPPVQAPPPQTPPPGPPPGPK